MASSINQAHGQRQPGRRTRDPDIHYTITADLFKFFPVVDSRRRIITKVWCSEVPISVGLPDKLDCVEWRPAAEVDEIHNRARFVLLPETSSRVDEWSIFCDFLRKQDLVALVRVRDDLYAYLKPLKTTDEVWAVFQDPATVAASAAAPSPRGYAGSIRVGSQPPSGGTITRVCCSEVPMAIKLPAVLHCVAWRPAAEVDETNSKVKRFVVYPDPHDKSRLPAWHGFCDYLRLTDRVAVIRIQHDLSAYLKPIYISLEAPNSVEVLALAFLKYAGTIPAQDAAASRPGGFAVCSTLSWPPATCPSMLDSRLRIPDTNVGGNSSHSGSFRAHPRARPRSPQGDVCAQPAAGRGSESDCPQLPEAPRGPAPHVQQPAGPLSQQQASRPSRAGRSRWDIPPPGPNAEGPSPQPGPTASRPSRSRVGRSRWDSGDSSECGGTTAEPVAGSRSEARLALVDTWACSGSSSTARSSSDKVRRRLYSATRLSEDSRSRSAR